LLKTNGIRRAFQRPEKGRCNETDVEVVKYLTNMRQEDSPMTRELIKIK
jgi:hypothetical protein